MEKFALGLFRTLWYNSFQRVQKLEVTKEHRPQTSDTHCHFNANKFRAQRNMCLAGVDMYTLVIL
jgi:hypothetical protein